MKRNYLTTNGLMKHLRENNIKIGGSRHKRLLINDGYYHGYKGYRFINKPGNRIQYSDYSQVSAVIEFDRYLKATLYPQLMYIETALKNITLEVVLQEGRSNKFNDIFDKLIICSPLPKNANSETRKDFHQKLELRNRIYAALSGAFKNGNEMVMHFYKRDDYVPIWAIFEILSLGEFGNFLKSLRPNTKKLISKSLKLNQTCDSDSRLVSRIVFILKDLRNAVAHNGIIFDTRFKTQDIDRSVVSCLEIDTGIKHIDFTSIVDYQILSIYVLKCLGVTKTDLRKYILQFESHLEILHQKIPANIYMAIVHSETKSKLASLKSFVKRKG